MNYVSHLHSLSKKWICLVVQPDLLGIYRWIPSSVMQQSCWQLTGFAMVWIFTLFVVLLSFFFFLIAFYRNGMWCFTNRDGNFSNKQFFHGNIKGANALGIPGVQYDSMLSFNFLLQAVKVFSCILVSFSVSLVILFSPFNFDCNTGIAFYFLPATVCILGRFIQCWQYTVVFSQENIWKITAINWLPL